MTGSVPILGNRQSSNSLQICEPYLQFWRMSIDVKRSLCRGLGWLNKKPRLISLSFFVEVRRYGFASVSGQAHPGSLVGWKRGGMKRGRGDLDSFSQMRVKLPSQNAFPGLKSETNWDRRWILKRLMAWLNRPLLHVVFHQPNELPV
jgi:hypothetical protein